MTATLRPMTLEEILDRTVQIYRQRFCAFIVMSTLPALAAWILSLAFFLENEYGPQTTLSASLKDSWMALGTWLPDDWLLMLMRNLMWPAFVFFASSIYLDEYPTLASAYSHCVVRRRSCFILAAVLWSTCYWLPGILHRLAYTSGHFFPEIRTVEDVVRLAMPVLVAFSVPAWAIEGLNVLPALRRGWIFGKRNWSHVFVVLLLVYILDLIFVFTLWFVISPIYRYFVAAHLHDGYSIPPILFGLYAKVATILVGPIYPIAITLIYYDQRIRHEGYDIERMMEAAGMNVSATPPAGASGSVSAVAGEGMA